MVTFLGPHYLQETWESQLLRGYMIDVTRKWMSDQENVNLGELAAGISHYLHDMMTHMVFLAQHDDHPGPKELARLLQSWRGEFCQAIDGVIGPYDYLLEHEDDYYETPEEDSEL